MILEIIAYILLSYMLVFYIAFSRKRPEETKSLLTSIISLLVVIILC